MHVQLLTYFVWALSLLETLGEKHARWHNARNCPDLSDNEESWKWLKIGNHRRLVALHPVPCASWGMWPWSRTAQPLRQPSGLRRCMDKWMHFRLRTPLLNIFDIVYIVCIHTSMQKFDSVTRGFCVRSWRAVLEMPKCSPPLFRWEMESWTCPFWCFAHPLLTVSNLYQLRMIECEIEIQWFQAIAK